MDKDKIFREFCHKLSKYKSSTRSEYEMGRETLCNLIMLTEYRGVKYPRFEVRGYRVFPDHVEISAVNWTVMAGTCTLYLKPEHVHEWDILEDNPTLQVLYGQ